MIYDSSAIYIQSFTQAQDRITAIDAIIDALMAQMLALATQDSPMEEYMLNDGQTIIKARYRTTQSIENSINALDRMKQIYMNRLNGRVVRMRDSKNLTGYNNGWW